jgi:hypothetical protein
MKSLKILLLLGLGWAVMGQEGCNESSDSIQNRKQEELSRQGVEQVGLPSIVNFQEKRTYKMILELRDTEIKTVTYIVDMSGKLHKVCDSVGYGIPYATQYTNPMQHIYGYAMPQADPNGLFSPTSADGTWVLCLNHETKKMSPVFIEPRVIVSPFALNL